MVWRVLITELRRLGEWVEVRIVIGVNLDAGGFGKSASDQPF